MLKLSDFETFSNRLTILELNGKLKFKILSTFENKLRDQAEDCGTLFFFDSACKKNNKTNCYLMIFSSAQIKQKWSFSPIWLQFLIKKKKFQNY
ncbi:hypothetical protein BpHYR1_029444 [Brachionus plicatilis]|uniref:Uncharacterized protein n=1 Tax=Brachionus plicatilis TaxID=10195 RepID=A0A3M7QSP0_BRAPC|nr:hypothetical protein BpHYR1_029444 [Brachionus plicatilis]